jgi:4-amino-4-deoxy-L-arabinose transferase-like glycosyltransferase
VALYGALRLWGPSSKIGKLLAHSISKPPPVVVLSAVALVILFARLCYPSLLIDRDEHTFLLGGALLNQGQVLYTDFFDLKPPLLFWVFAGIDALADNDIIVVRLLGALMVIVAAWLVALAVAPRVGWGWAGMMALGVGLASLHAGNQAVMSAVVALPFLALAALSLVRLRGQGDPSARWAPAWAFLAGLAMGAACLVRLNLGIAALVLALAVFWPDRGERWDRQGLARFGAYAAGGLLWSVPLLIAFPPEVVVQALIMAPMTYIGENPDMIEVTFLHLRSLLVNFDHFPLSIGMLAWLCLPAVRRAAGGWQRSDSDMALVAAAVLVSILVTGQHYSHYRLQMAPWMALLAAPGWLGLSRWLAGRKTGRSWRWAWRGIIAVLLVGPLAVHGMEGARAWTNPRPDVARILADRLEDIGAGTGAAFTAHGALWAADVEPVMGLVLHPSNIKPWRLPMVEAGTGRSLTQLGLLREIAAQRPDVVILYSGKRVEAVFEPEARAWLRAWLAREYAAPEQIMGTRLYVLK